MSMDRRQEILKAAEVCFSEYGYKATTMSGVSKMARVGKGTIYTFFETKEELFQAILKAFIDRMRAVAEEAIVPGQPFEVNLHQALMAILQFRKEHQLMIKLPQEIRVSGSAEAEKALELVETAIIQFLESRIEKGMANGDLVEVNPTLTAFAMFRLYIALVFDWENHHPPLAKEEIASLFERLMINGIKNKVYTNGGSDEA